MEAAPFKTVCGIKRDCTFFPIDLGVVILKPVIPQNQFISEAWYDIKQLLFMMIPNLEVHHSCFSEVPIGGAIP
jgi:hypothetical protein